MYAVAPRSRRRSRQPHNTHFSKTVQRFPSPPRTPHSRHDTPHGSPRSPVFDFSAPPTPPPSRTPEPRSPSHDPYPPLASPMSPDEFAEERETLEALQTPRSPYPPPVDAFEVRRQNARRGTFPDPLSADEAEEEQAVLRRAEKRREKARRPESRRESKVRYRREHASAPEGGASEPEDEDWRAAIEGEYSPSPSPSAGESSPEEEDAPEPRPAARRTRTTRRPATASVPAKWMGGLMSSERDKPRKPGVPQRKAWRPMRPERRYLGRIGEEPGEEERGEQRHGGEHFQSSPEESQEEDERRPLGRRHAHSSPSPERERRSLKERRRGPYDEEFGPAHLHRRPDQEEKGWSWAAIQRSGSKQCLLAGGVTLVRQNAFLPRETLPLSFDAPASKVVALVAFGGWAIWYFGTQYHK